MARDVNVGGWIAYGAYNAAVALAGMLVNEITNAKATGDYTGITRLLGILESWRNSTNPEEVKAYRIFMRYYGRLYREAKRLLAKEGC